MSAHHCDNKHPYSRIMKEFYWASKAKRESVPYVLGLTASPVVRSEISALEKLEHTLDAVCRSPTKHRDELLAYSQRPCLVSITYKTRPSFLPSEHSESLKKLVAARNKLDIMEDPLIVSLIHDKSDRARRQLEKALKQRSTYVQDSMKSFCRSVLFQKLSLPISSRYEPCSCSPSSSGESGICNCFHTTHVENRALGEVHSLIIARRSVEMAISLGTWAADWYIFETIKRFLAGIRRQGATSESWRDAEVVYLARVFQDADIRPPSVYEQSSFSDKVQRLIGVLLSNDDGARGIGASSHIAFLKIAHC